MVTNVTSLLKTVKAVEDEHTRGTRALESTVEAIGQEMRVSIEVLIKNFTSCLSLLRRLRLFVHNSFFSPAILKLLLMHVTNLIWECPLMLKGINSFTTYLSYSNNNSSGHVNNS